VTYAVVRVRGTAGVRGDIADTLAMLRLHKPNHCVLVPEDPVHVGMLQKVKDRVTWGEVDHQTLAPLIKFMSRLEGNRRLTDYYVKKNSEFTSISSLAKAIAKGEATLMSVPGLKPVLRLHPPLKGYGDVRRPFQLGGAVGYRAEGINELIQRMIVREV
jgi:large subunit ribosomal protein L30